ncbi:hypothetical protein D3C85_952480 [compost metagenome]
MIGGSTRQKDEAVFQLPPRLPVAATISQAKQTAAAIKSWLLQRLLSLIAGHATGGTKGTVALALGNHQTGRGPWLIGATPLDPGQSTSVGTECRCSVKVGTFGQ